MLKLKFASKAATLPLVVTLLLAGLIAAGATAGAASNSTDKKTVSANQNITQAYSADQPLQRGMIVGLDDQKANSVFALDSDRVQQMQGVVVAANDAPVTLSDNTSSSQVYVATLGRYPVLVSNQNGAIKAGDYITISSLTGIGMKADSSSQLVIGKAAESFDGNDNALGNETLTTANGGKKQVSIGLVNTDLGIAHNPLRATSHHQVKGVGWLQNAAESVTGERVSTSRVYAAAAIFIVVAIIVIIILYSGIRGDMIAAGRNPLAKAAIGRNLFEVVLSAIVIFIIGLGAIYLVLKI